MHQSFQTKRRIHRQLNTPLAPGARESSPCMSKMAKYCRFCVCRVSFVTVGVGRCCAGRVLYWSGPGKGRVGQCSQPYQGQRCAAPARFNAMAQQQPQRLATPPAAAIALQRHRAAASPRYQTPQPRRRRKPGRRATTKPATVTPAKVRQARHNKARSRDGSADDGLFFGHADDAGALAQG